MLTILYFTSDTICRRSVCGQWFLLVCLGPFSITFVFRVTNTISIVISLHSLRLGRSKDWLCYSNTNILLSRHGLSYTTFSLSDLVLSQPIVSGGEFNLTVSLTVTNTGTVAGSEIVQVYTSLPTTSDLTHPPLQLKGFAKVRYLAPGTSEQVQIKLDKYAVSYWSELYDTWTVEKGVYGVKVGSSSDRLDLDATFEIDRGFEWRGL